MATQIKEMKPLICIYINEGDTVGVKYTPQGNCDTATIGYGLVAAAICVAEEIRNASGGDRASFDENLSQIVAALKNLSIDEEQYDFLKKTVAGGRT